MREEPGARKAVRGCAEHIVVRRVPHRSDPAILNGDLGVLVDDVLKGGNRVQKEARVPLRSLQKIMEIRQVLKHGHSLLEPVFGDLTEARWTGALAISLHDRKKQVGFWK